MLGEYYISINSDGKITIPKSLNIKSSDELIITTGIDKCVSIYKKETFNDIMKKYSHSKTINLMIKNSSKLIINDDEISINDTYLKYAGISKECVIIGLIDHFEIWSKELWKNEEKNINKNIDEIVDKIGNKRV